jgi:large subunit ribosomal protein L9
MKIILNQDIMNLGEEGDIKTVADGYARNFLIPKKMAVPHTKKNMLILESRKAIIEQRKEEKRKEALGLKEKLSELEIVLKMPAGENDKLFGSVSSAMISEELEKLGHSIERKRIEVPEKHIKMLGDFNIAIKLYGNEKAEIKLKIEKALEKQ